MASVDSMEEQQTATAAGWRTFRVARDLAAGPKEIVCPNTTAGVQCADCGLCRGTAVKAKSILIEVHGVGQSNFQS
jgi:hypothetical protein